MPSSAAPAGTHLRCRSCAAPCPQQSATPQAAEPKAGSELLQALRQQNQELQRVRQELEATKQKAAAPSSAPVLAAPTLTAPPAPAPAVVRVPPPPVATPAPAPAAVEEEEGEEGGSAFGALNLVGILAAGGLAGYLSLQKKEAQETEAEYQLKLQSGAAPHRLCPQPPLAPVTLSVVGCLPAAPRVFCSFLAAQSSVAGAESAAPYRRPKLACPCCPC